MNDGTGVIDESLRVNRGKPCAVATGNESYPQAVETSVNTGLLKQVIDSAILLGAESAGKPDSFARKLFQEWAELMVYRDGKILTWIVLAALGIAQPNSAACQVDVFHWNRALRKPATSVESNFKTDSHPFGLICELDPDFGNIVVRQFGFDLLGCSGDAQPCNGVGFGKLTPDRFIDELGQELDLQERSIVHDSPSVYRIRYTPADIRPAMRVSDLPGVDDAVLVQERFNGLPSDRVTPSGIAFPLPMGCDVAWNPSEESGGSERPANPLFFNRSFFGQPLRLSGVGSVVNSQAGGFVHPDPRIKIAFADIPKGRPSMLPDVRHSRIVSLCLPKVKWKEVDAEAVSVVNPWTVMGLGRLPLHDEALQTRHDQPLAEQSPISLPKTEVFGI